MPRHARRNERSRGSEEDEQVPGQLTIFYDYIPAEGEDATAWLQALMDQVDGETRG